jgi:hypothetical protein
VSSRTNLAGTWQPVTLGTLAGLCLLFACARKQPPPVALNVSQADTTVAGLPRSAYLIALDSSLPRVRTGGKRVFVHSGDWFWPLTSEDLRVRRLERKNDTSVCAGEAVLWFQVPQRGDNGQLRLDIVEASGASGLAGGHAYLFRCTVEACRLENQAPLNSDYLVGCRQER